MSIIISLKNIFSGYKLNLYSRLIQDLFQLCIHVRHVELAYYRRYNGHLDNRDLRIKYLLDRISEPEWVSTMQKREKQMMKKREIYQVIEMFDAVLNERLLKIINVHRETSRNKDNITRMEELLNTLKDIPPLINYANNEFKKIGHRFKNMSPLITREFAFQRTGQN